MSVVPEFLSGEYDLSKMSGIHSKVLDPARLPKVIVIDAIDDN